MSKFHEILKGFFECIIKFDLFTYLKLNSIKNYGVWKDCEINLQNLVKSWNFGCKRPLKLSFSGDEGRMVKRLDIWPLFGLKRFDLNRKWLHRKPKRQVWINLNFMHLQKIEFSNFSEKWVFEVIWRLAFDKVDSAASTSSKLNQAVAIIIFDWLEWFAEIMTPRQITSEN